MEEIDEYTGLPIGCHHLNVDDVVITVPDSDNPARLCPGEDRRRLEDRRCEHRRSIDSGVRHNEGKTRLSMLLDAPFAVEGVVRVMEYGCKKYDRNNWKRGLNHTEVVDSMLRHLSSYLKGEDLDPESGLLHVDHITANAVFLAELVRIKPEFDDRKKRYK